MIAGLASKSSPPLPIPVQDSKEWESGAKAPSEFKDVLKDKESVRTDEPKSSTVEKVQRAKEPKAERRSEETEDTEQISESPPDPKMVDPRMRAQRERAIRKFMDSFEGEFGIPPEKMVDAMAQLTAQEQVQPPEKTVEHVISELKLDPQDELKAKKMYMGLLMQLNQIDAKVDLPKSTEGLLSQLSAERFQLGQEKKDFRQGQVQALSDKFWMRGSATDQVVHSGSDPKVMELMKKSIDPAMMGIEEVPVQELPPEVEQILSQLKSDLKKEENPELEEAAPQEAMPFMPQVMKPVVKTQEANNANVDLNQIKAEMPELANLENMSPEVKQVFEKMVNKANLQTKKPVLTEKLDVSQMLGAGQINQKIEIDTSVLPVVKPEVPVNVSPADKTENVQQIMNQAQILLKKGGGEVKVEMSPEGMGSVQMKLKVLDGKVQLQMSTETKEAKKMIETSLHDLKTSLAAHQLSMEHVKVDVVNQTTQSSDARQDLQNQMQNFLNQQQKEGTRQFWQQFNENFGNRQARESYFDAQNMKTGMREQKLPGFGDSNSSQALRTQGSRGRSLNLVA